MFLCTVKSASAGFAVVALVAAGTASSSASPSHHVPATATGPSTTVSPYVLPVAAGVSITSLLTVDDKPAGNGVGMVGVPDGLGVTKQGRDAVVYMNQEFQAAQGAVHAHGQPGAFVTRNVIDRRTGEVKEATDFITTVRHYDYATGTYGAAATAPFLSAFSRFCSASLTDPGLLKDGRVGYAGQIYFANEENGDSGRAFGVTADGTATQLPRLGLFSWENTNVADTDGPSTVVVGNEDGGTGQLRVYVGQKQRTGSAVEKAGLTNGSLSVVDVANQTVTTDAQFRTAYGKGVEVPAQANAINWNATGADQNTEAAARGISLNRIEDGGFDPRHPNDYYFITTEGGSTTSVENDPITGVPIARDGGGLWRLRFVDVENPSSGMTLTLVLDGSEAPYLNKPDNMDVDERGHLLIQEDPGGNAHLARVLAYDIASGQVVELAQFDPARFASGATGYPNTIDEESSGIIDVEDLAGDGVFLFDAQVHTNVGLHQPLTQVEHGQLLRMHVDWMQIFVHDGDDDGDDDGGHGRDLGGHGRGQHRLS